MRIQKLLSKNSLWLLQERILQAQLRDILWKDLVVTNLPISVQEEELKIARQFWTLKWS